MGSYLLGELEERVLDGVVLDGLVGLGRAAPQYVDHVEQLLRFAALDYFRGGFDKGLINLTTDHCFIYCILDYTNSTIANWGNAKVEQVSQVGKHL